MDNEIKNILDNSKTVAVVGLSDKPYRPSQGVALYLQEHGYKIIPVNPNINEVLGEKSYALTFPPKKGPFKMRNYLL